MKILYQISNPYTDVLELVRAKVSGDFTLMPIDSSDQVEYMRQIVYRFEQLERIVLKATT